MPVSRLKFESLPHAIFLQRVSGPESATTLEARLGQAAFLALRLVDLLAPDRGPVSPDAFHYHWVATAIRRCSAGSVGPTRCWAAATSRTPSTGSRGSARRRAPPANGMSRP